MLLDGRRRRLRALGPRLYDLKEPSGRATSLVDALLAASADPCTLRASHDDSTALHEAAEKVQAAQEAWLE
mgnify:CR=1 FL=1